MRKTVFSILAFIAKNCPSYDTVLYINRVMDYSYHLIMFIDILQLDNINNTFRNTGQNMVNEILIRILKIHTLPITLIEYHYIINFRIIHKKTITW